MFVLIPPSRSRPLSLSRVSLPCALLYEESEREREGGGGEGESERSNSSPNQFASKGGFTVRSLGPFYHHTPPSLFSAAPSCPFSSFTPLPPPLTTLPFRERIQSASKTSYNHPPSGIRRSTLRFSFPKSIASTRRGKNQPL